MVSTEARAEQAEFARKAFLEAGKQELDALKLRYSEDMARHGAERQQYARKLAELRARVVEQQGSAQLK